MAETGLPLEGVRVVEMTHMVIGPTCGMILAQLGAEVVKVEPPAGDKTRTLGGMGTAFFPLFNRGKRSVVLDFAKPEDRDTMDRLLASADAIEDMHVMLQREVAARLGAQPGTGDYGRLTVMLAPWVQVERLFDVGPGAFQPPPRVWSRVLRLTVRREPLFPVSAHYARVVAAAFAQRRKTLRNALSQMLTAAEISACGLDPGARPGTLAPQAFNTLALAAGRAALDRTRGER